MHAVDESLLDEVAEVRKKKFLQLVECLARLRDSQYETENAEGILNIARKIVSRNLPSNLLRAAAILVDYIHDFPPNRSSFWKPDWIDAKELLPQGKRGSLVCSGLKDISELEEGDLIILTQDISSKGLHAGMAGIVKEIVFANKEDEIPNSFLVEFGEPEESITEEIEVLANILRTPRPGDLLENFRS